MPTNIILGVTMITGRTTTTITIMGHGHHHNENRTFAEIKKLIGRSKLSSWVKKKSVAVFQRIAEAEGKIHGLPPEQVHFHEVGAVDSIVDIVGACIALEMLGQPRVLAAPVVEGTGWIDCAHGRFPVPAPATLAILGARGIGVTQCDEPHELVTPTGAALLAEFVEDFGPMQNLVAEKIGFGLGTRDNQTRPNVLRVVLGKSEKSRRTNDTTGRKAVGAHHPLDWETDRIAVLETNLDDISGEILGHFVEPGVDRRRAGCVPHAHPDEKKPARRAADGFVRRRRRGQIQRNDFARDQCVRSAADPGGAAQACGANSPGSKRRWAR